MFYAKVWSRMALYQNFQPNQPFFRARVPPPGSSGWRGELAIVVKRVHVLC